MTHDAWSQSETWEPFVYRAQVLNVTDGDTIKCRLDKGFYDYHIAPIRLSTVDTREIHFVSHDSHEYERGMKHKQFTEDWVHRVRQNDREWPFIVKTVAARQNGKYGRPLGRLFDADDEYPPVDHALLDAFDDVEHYG